MYVYLGEAVPDLLTQVNVSAPCCFSLHVTWRLANLTESQELRINLGMCGYGDPIG